MVRFLRISLPLALLGLLLLSAVQEPEVDVEAEAKATAPVSIYLVRHAETGGDTRTDRDPGLSEAGKLRGEELARMLMDVPVTHVFASEYQRTQATVAPTAAARGLEVQVGGARDASALVKELQSLPPGSVALVAGHSNTVPALVDLLGGVIPGFEALSSRERVFRHEVYDRLILVHLPGHADVAVSTQALRYGAPPAAH